MVNHTQGGNGLFMTTMKEEKGKKGEKSTGGRIDPTLPTHRPGLACGRRISSERSEYAKPLGVCVCDNDNFYDHVMRICKHRSGSPYDTEYCSPCT